MSNDSSHKGEEFKRLQEEWYRKLEESGFKDAENCKTGKLKSWSEAPINGRRSAHAHDQIRESTQYYHSAQCLLNDYRFQSIRDRRIWGLHCNGLSTRQIEALLTAVDHCTVYQTIKRIRALILEVDKTTSPCINMVAIRDGTLQDADLIYATWIRSVQNGNTIYAEINNDKFIRAATHRVTNILNRGSVQVKIACLADDPDVILGYSVIEWRKLWWIYVKKAWREMGIAKKLIPPHINSCGYMTNLGRQLKPKAWEIDPYFPEELE